MSAGQTAARQNEVGGTADIGGYSLTRRSSIAGSDGVTHIGMKPDRVAFRQSLWIGTQVEIDHRSRLEPERANDLHQDRRMRRFINRKVKRLSLIHSPSPRDR